jgi:hypothetical protein
MDIALSFSLQIVNRHSEVTMSCTKYTTHQTTLARNLTLVTVAMVTGFVIALNISVRAVLCHLRHTRVSFCNMFPENPKLKNLVTCCQCISFDLYAIVMWAEPDRDRELYRRARSSNLICNLVAINLQIRTSTGYFWASYNVKFLPV